MSVYYSNRKKKDHLSGMLKKLSMQLSIVFAILLFVMLIKYTDTKISRGINGKLKEVFNSQFSIDIGDDSNTNEVLGIKFPGLKDIVNKLFKKPEKDFYIDAMPVEGEITSFYGERIHPVTKQDDFHTGIDIDAEEGTDIKLVLDGVVEKVETDENFGNYIIVLHENGFKTLYAHLLEVNVKNEDELKKGDVIGKVGNTGNSTGPHLHFEIIKENKSVDPEDYLK